MISWCPSWKKKTSAGQPLGTHRASWGGLRLLLQQIQTILPVKIGRASTGHLKAIWRWPTDDTPKLVALKIGRCPQNDKSALKVPDEFPMPSCLVKNGWYAGRSPPSAPGDWQIFFVIYLLAGRWAHNWSKSDWVITRSAWPVPLTCKLHHDHNWDD